MIVDDPTQNFQLLVISALVPIVVMETQGLIRKVFWLKYDKIVSASRWAYLEQLFAISWACLLSCKNYLIPIAHSGCI